MKKVQGLLLATSCIAPLMFAPAAFAQDTAPADEAADDEIVVTGTLLRGVAPVGTNVVGVDAAAIKSSGATTTAQVLQQVPQLAFFNDLQAPSSSGNSVTVNRPNLRNLPGNTTAGGSTTLVLMNGHRLVGAGVVSTSPDPDVIPVGAIERLEIVPDGGSAIYGADAVAGVMNFITRKKFDGFMVDGHYGFADDYKQWDVNLTAGKDWGDGGIYVSYSYAKNDRITGADRDFVKTFPGANGLLPLFCSPGTLTIPAGQPGAGNYVLPGRTPGTNQCDYSDGATHYPGIERHSIYSSFTQDLNDWMTIDIHGYYTKRDTFLNGGEHRPTAATTVTAASPFFAANVIGTETSHSVFFNIGNANSQLQEINLDTWGITPSLTFKIGSNWQLKVMGNYGESDILSRKGEFNATALTNSINSFNFNPYNSSAPGNAAALRIINNYHTYGHARQRLTNFRAVLDGDLFDLPGGAVKVAVGTEYYKEGWRSRSGAAVPGFETTGAPAQLIGATTIAPATTPLRLIRLGRNVKSVFGEVVVPLFGADNAMGGFQELSVSVAGRYDEYSDHGDTFNPKIGLTWKPADWLKIRGSWGKSFNAPSLADSPAADVTTLFVLPQAFFPVPGALTPTPYPAPLPTDRVYVMRGNSNGIKPQKAKTWSIGADFTPVDGIKFGATYFNIDLKGVIGIPPGQSSALVYAQYPQVVTIAPTDAFLDTLVGISNVFPFGPACHTVAAGNCNVYSFVDIRKSNLGDFKLAGVDSYVSVTQDIGLGTLMADVNASYETKREQRSAPTQPWIDLFDAGASRLKVKTMLGLETGGLLSQVTWRHSAGYDLNPVVGFVPQSKVGSYNVVDLFFKYDFGGEGMGKDLSLTLNVNNVFDQDPPEYRLFNVFTPGFSGFINGNTIGRLVQFGINKKF